VVTSAISSGLHRLPDHNLSKITAAAEYKRRLFSAVYCSDKIHASLNGTPPLISRRSCDIEPCLDLAPCAPYLSSHELIEATQKLDTTGWNTMERLYDTTLLRAKVYLSIIREDILDLSLGISISITEQIIR
jgi:hypothetical protein